MIALSMNIKNRRLGTRNGHYGRGHRYSKSHIIWLGQRGPWNNVFAYICEGFGIQMGGRGNFLVPFTFDFRQPVLHAPWARPGCNKNEHLMSSICLFQFFFIFPKHNSLNHSSQLAITGDRVRDSTCGIWSSISLCTLKFNSGRISKPSLPAQLQIWPFDEIQ